MSFDFPSQPPHQVRPRSGGCGRLIFMLMIVFAVYYMFSADGGQRPKPLPQGKSGPGDVIVPAPQGIDDDHDAIKQEIFGDGIVDSSGRGLGNSSGRKMPSTGRSRADHGWQMDDVEARKKSDNDFRNDSRLPKPSNSDARSKSDWSIEDADTPNAEAVPSGSQQTPRNKTKGDWSLDEID